MQRTREKKALLVAEESMRAEYEEHSTKVEGILNSFGVGKDMWDKETLEDLNTLVETAMQVGVDPFTATAEDIVEALSEEIDREFNIELRCRELEQLKESLEGIYSDTTSLKSRLEQSVHFQTSKQDLLDDTLSEWTLNANLINTKSEEYKSRTLPLKVPPFQPPC
jgi:hypothetical protein